MSWCQPLVGDIPGLMMLPRLRPRVLPSDKSWTSPRRRLVLRNGSDVL
jgi:hypothetical protein